MKCILMLDLLSLSSKWESSKWRHIYLYHNNFTSIFIIKFNFQTYFGQIKHTVLIVLIIRRLSTDYYTIVTTVELSQNYDLSEHTDYTSTYIKCRH